APLAGELLSSWLSRVAHAHGLGPAVLMRHLRRYVPVSATDVDVTPLPKLVHHLSGQTGHPPSRIATLQRFAPPERVALRRLGSGPRFCPGCWRRDPVPHVPWEWRFAPSLACLRHRTLLVAGCPACGQPLEPLTGWVRRPMWRCGGCGADLRRAQARRAPREVLRGQARLLDLHALAEDLERSDWAEAILLALEARQPVTAGEAGILAAVASIGRSTHDALPLLGGIDTSSARRVFLQVLAHGSLATASMAPTMPARSWELLDAQALPTVRRAAGRELGLLDLAVTWASVRARCPDPPGDGATSALAPEVPPLVTRSAVPADVVGVARLMQERLALASSEKDLAQSLRYMMRPRGSIVYVGEREGTAVAMAAMIQFSLSLFVAEADDARALAFLRSVELDACPWAAALGRDRIEAFVSPRRATVFQTAGWVQSEGRRTGFACDDFRTPKEVNLHLVRDLRALPAWLC
ncbi:MAG: TniQ family protein, partial [Thermoleophilia bacterium]|nr:TniQ family protein [Thermoleophilia bacterium]